jgi:hypothetical protein
MSIMFPRLTNPLVNTSHVRNNASAQPTNLYFRAKDTRVYTGRTREREIHNGGPDRRTPYLIYEREYKETIFRRDGTSREKIGWEEYSREKI